MSDLSKKPPPNYAPVYAAAMYPELAKIARAHGYALAVHGSMARDFDLVAVPWADEACEPDLLVAAMMDRRAMRLVGGPPSQMPHGRIAYTLSVGFGECAIDLSFMPRGLNPMTRRRVELLWLALPIPARLAVFLFGLSLVCLVAMAFLSGCATFF